MVYLAYLGHNRSEHGEAVVEALPPSPLRHEVLRRLPLDLLLHFLLPLITLMAGTKSGQFGQLFDLTWIDLIEMVVW